MSIEKLTGDASSKILRKWNSNKEPYVTGYDIEAYTVFSLSYGSIVYAGLYNKFYTVDVKINDSELIRYSHLKDCQVFEGCEAIEGSIIGTTRDYVRFEYLTSWQGKSKFCVRVNNKNYYKQDPYDILFDNYFPALGASASVIRGATFYKSKPTYTEVQSNEFLPQTD